VKGGKVGVVPLQNCGCGDLPSKNNGGCVGSQSPTLKFRRE